MRGPKLPSRPQGLAYVLALLTSIFLLAACGGGSAPSAQQLITSAQAAIQKVTSYHFNLVVDNPGIGGVLTIKSADGDILVPDKLQAKATTILLGSVVQVQIIAIADKQYITDPITGKWEAPPVSLIDPRTLSNSSTGVAAILGHIQNPSTPIDATVDGTACWSINGMLDAQYLAAITGGGTPAGTMVAVTVCIGKADNLPYQIRMSGIAAAGDTSKTVRTFKLSKFGESLTITAPI